MKVLVVGGTGATGSLLVRDLLSRGHEVRTIVRSVDRLPDDVREHERLKATQANLLDLSQQELQEHVRDTDAVASCLGHNPTFWGMVGRPRRLVTLATKRLWGAMQQGAGGRPTKYVLMGTVAVRNRDLLERVSLRQRIVIGLLRSLLPPVADNEAAASFLRKRVGREQGDRGWAIVRPDSLTNEKEVTPYEIHPSPTRSALFNPGKTTRINVAHFMARLITDDSLWAQWKGKMPVIYNR